MLFRSPAPATGQATVRLVAYNVKHGLGMDERIDLERVADVLRPLDADVITLQEIDVGVERSARVDQAEALGRLLDMDAFFGDFMPYQGGEYGMAVLTRLPVQDVRNIRLPDGAEPRTSLAVTVEAQGGVLLTVAGIHLYRTPEERLAQAEVLSDAFDGSEQPVALVGDFNSRRGDIVLDHLVGEGWHVLDKTGSALTYPSDIPAREIDFVMLRPASAFEVLEHRVIPESLASDHRPLLAVLRMW